MFGFKIDKKDKLSSARIGTLTTPRGLIRTPAFVPVATKGALKGTDFDSAVLSGADIFMMNTFHFFCNERYKDVSRFGGLHKFIGREEPIMTDSGGFQVFSLGSGWDYGVGKLAESKVVNKKKSRNTSINEEGVIFRSPYNGEKLKMTPETSIKVQERLGADIIFAFDECTSPLDSYDYIEEAMGRTHRWASRCIKAFNGNNQVMMGIIQGGPYLELREKSAEFINSLPFFGFGIGGSFGGSYGDSKANMNLILDRTLPLLLDSKPRHLLGIGEIDDIFESVERGIDLFDCVIPVRWARHGMAMIRKGRINLKLTKLLKSKNPIDENCNCRVCKKYHLGYISHLLKEKEIYGISLLAEHNLFFVLDTMREIREAIKQGEFLKLKEERLNWRVKPLNIIDSF